MKLTGIRNDRGQPFSKWKPADKFAYVFGGVYPTLWRWVDEEHRFDAVRRWRFDFAWPDLAVAVEIDGFGFGHQAQQGMAADNDKQNAAVVSGWRVFRFNSRQLGSQAGVRDAVDLVAGVLCDAQEIKANDLG